MSAKTERVEVSVIIPCLNEEDYVHALLEDLTRQTGIGFEVIVVDSESEDDTKKVAAGYSDRLNLTLVEGERKGPAAARNLGAQHATGTWLLFLDADVELPESSFLRVLVTEAERRDLVTASAVYKVNSERRSDVVGGQFTLRYQKMLSKTKHPVACGYCILTRKDRFTACDGFDQKLRVGEDYDYVSRSAGEEGRFAFIEQTYFKVNLRRFEEGGRTKEFLKAIGYEVYRFTHGYKIERDPFGYTFGQHKKKSR